MSDGARALRWCAWCLAPVILAAAGQPALGDNLGRGVGAIHGAIIGDMIGGPGGAALGAAAGAMIGADGARSRDQQYLDRKRAEADARLARWEAERRRQELEAAERRERSEHFAALSASADLDLLLDIQRELIDRGYDAGPVGIQSAELTTAIVRYQAKEGLLPNGAMTQSLLEHLRADEE